MRTIATAIERYWWGVVTTLAGVCLIVVTIRGILQVTVGDFSLLVLDMPTIFSLGGAFFFFLIWIVGGFSLIYSGTSQIVKKSRAAAERGN